MCYHRSANGLLEHPEEAFSYYLHEGVAKVVCEEKHLGSRVGGRGSVREADCLLASVLEGLGREIEFVTRGLDPPCRRFFNERRFGTCNSLSVFAMLWTVPNLWDDVENRLALSRL
jgi:protein phosphatase